jgi:hypothetical protein
MGWLPAGWEGCRGALPPLAALKGSTDMSGLVRPTPEDQILDLARRLAEDYDAIPLAQVSRAVREAASTAIGGTPWSGTPAGIPAILDVIEQVAREDLEDTQLDHGPVSRRRAAGLGPSGARRPKRRQGAASRG